MLVRLALLSFLSGTAPAAQLTPKPPFSSCVRALRDTASDACLEASSTPTSGMLLPYPGEQNTFTGSSIVPGGRGNAAWGEFTTIGGGKENTILIFSDYSTVAGGVGNSATREGASIGGGSGNEGAGRYSTIGGGSDNATTSPWGTVGGGSGNVATGVFATVGGGEANEAALAHSTVSGGLYNRASELAAVGGGARNYATGVFSSISGGLNNSAAGGESAVLGGYGNVASGFSSTVVGGSENVSAGSSSLAAGRGAKALHDGSFVWGDGFGSILDPPDKSSSAEDQFNVYAGGGTRMFSSSDGTTGVFLAPGGGSWTSVSDRNSKENVEAVDGRAVLAKLASTPVSSWNYKTQDDAVRHMGPMAQDFYAAFGLGLDDKGIDTIDADGVALAAIQGLKAEKDAEVARLLEANAELRARVQELESLQRELASRVAELRVTASR